MDQSVYWELSDTTRPDDTSNRISTRFFGAVGVWMGSGEVLVTGATGQSGTTVGSLEGGFWGSDDR